MPAVSSGVVQTVGGGLTQGARVEFTHSVGAKGELITVDGKNCHLAVEKVFGTSRVVIHRSNGTEFASNAFHAGDELIFTLKATHADGWAVIKVS